MREESRFDPDALSVAGARGLMQLMPRTAARLSGSAAEAAGIDLRDAQTNITLGASYLKALSGEFPWLPAALAAYNAGEDRVRGWLRQGEYASVDEFIEDIPFDETRNYVKKVLTSYAQYGRLNDRSRTSCPAADGQR
jgi:soluble lytic murein transglycosylase